MAGKMAKLATNSSGIQFISLSQVQLAECVSVLWNTYWNSYGLLDGVARYTVVGYQMEICSHNYTFWKVFQLDK